MLKPGASQRDYTYLAKCHIRLDFWPKVGNNCPKIPLSCSHPGRLKPKSGQIQENSRKFSRTRSSGNIVPTSLECFTEPGTNAGDPKSHTLGRNRSNSGKRRAEFVWHRSNLGEAEPSRPKSSTFARDRPNMAEPPSNPGPSSLDKIGRTWANSNQNQAEFGRSPL